MKKTIIFALFAVSISVRAESLLLNCQVNDFGIQSLQVIQDETDLIGWTGLVINSSTGAFRGTR